MGRSWYVIVALWRGSIGSMKLPALVVMRRWRYLSEIKPSIRTISWKTYTKRWYFLVMEKVLLLYHDDKLPSKFIKPFSCIRPKNYFHSLDLSDLCNSPHYLIMIITYDMEKARIVKITITWKRPVRAIPHGLQKNHSWGRGARGVQFFGARGERIQKWNSP